jgi:teichoic acid transport system permease protein
VRRHRDHALIPALLMQATFNMGAALFMARVGAGAQDISQLVPFLLRVWRYFCGVMYSIAALPAVLPEWGKNVLRVIWRTWVRGRSRTSTTFT